MNIQLIGNVLGTLRQFRQHDAWTRQQLEAYQAEQLSRLRQYAAAHSPFYQQFHRGLENSPLEELPVLTKAMLMKHFNALVTDRSIHLQAVQDHLPTIRGDELLLGRYRATATSGSSGHPGIFLFNLPEWTMVLASFARAREWAGVKTRLTHRVKTAIVASTTPWHMSTRTGATVESWWMPTLRLGASEPLAAIVDQLNVWQPEILVAYASMNRLLAEEQLAGRLRISPKCITSASEVLTDEARKRIELAWGQVLFNDYVATECGGLAAEDASHQGLSLFEDLVIFEVVDEHNQPVPPGNFGEKVLLTVLFNHTQPLIRYELSDSVRLATAPDPAGRPYRCLDGIQGRREDTLTFPASQGGIVTVHPHAFHALMDSLPVSGWQIVQEANGLKVLLSGVRDGFVEESFNAALRKILVAQGVLPQTIQIQQVAAIPRTAAGKAPLIKSNTHQPAPSMADLS